jgi:cullin 3
LLTVFT